VSTQSHILPGQKPGNRRVRVQARYTPFFRYSGPGQYMARPAASTPLTVGGRAWAGVKSVLLGRPLSTHEEITQRLSKIKALAIFSSDPISSTAYATEEILRALVVAGTAALALSLPISVAIVLLILIVSTSYRQIAYAYPSGGGAYAVAQANLSEVAALVAAGALLVDYVMTVAVSVSSAAQQVVSAVPSLAGAEVAIGVGAIVIITLGNLRGIRESGNLFAVPTYLFVVSTLVMIALGVAQLVMHGGPVPPESPLARPETVLEPVTLLLLLRAFASGSVALTGTEAIANGVPAFKKPEPRNAATTLTVVALLLAVLFIGITFLANAYGLVPTDVGPAKTIISQIAGVVFGSGSVPFLAFQAFTALILFLAANTSYNAFPRLGAILARDDYAPRQLAFRGDRLSYSVGIFILSGLAVALLVAFGGDTHALIPLYSVGVFVSFSISQGGMVIHWLRHEASHRWARLALNGLGCVVTSVVAVVVLVAKAPTSLVVVLVIPALVLAMLFVSRRYRAARASLAIPPGTHVARGARLPRGHHHDRAVIPVAVLDRSVLRALEIARSVSDDIVAVFVTDDPAEGDRVREEWEAYIHDVPLVTIESPYRAMVSPLLAYLHVLDQETTESAVPTTFVVIPEYAARYWWERLLYGQVSKRLRSALLNRPHTVVVDVPYRAEGTEAADPYAEPPSGGLLSLARSRGHHR
jgi:amino acid transporter